MIFVDASAITAILGAEPEAAACLARIEAADRRITSPIAVWETAIAMARLLDLPPAEAAQAVDALLAAARITVIPVHPEATPIAIDAFARYGKGRHSAALNMGDCFAYAAARHSGAALLFKGNDFGQTDIQVAW